MRKFSVYAALLLTLLPTFLAAQQTDPQSVIQVNAPPVSVAETTWAGTDSSGEYFEYYFQANGDLHYKVPSGLHKNGAWKQDGNEIYMEMNKKYSQNQGLISGTRMEGTGWNETGLIWTWVAEKK